MECLVYVSISIYAFDTFPYSIYNGQDRRHFSEQLAVMTGMI